eukprot:403377458
MEHILSFKQKEKQVLLKQSPTKGLKSKRQTMFKKKNLNLNELIQQENQFIYTFGNVENIERDDYSHFDPDLMKSINGQNVYLSKTQACVTPIMQKGSKELASVTTIKIQQENLCRSFGSKRVSDLSRNTAHTNTTSNINKSQLSKIQTQKQNYNRKQIHNFAKTFTNSKQSIMFSHEITSPSKVQYNFDNQEGFEDNYNILTDLSTPGLELIFGNSSPNCGLSQRNKTPIKTSNKNVKKIKNEDLIDVTKVSNVKRKLNFNQTPNKKECLGQYTSPSKTITLTFRIRNDRRLLAHSQQVMYKQLQQQYKILQQEQRHQTKSIKFFKNYFSIDIYRTKFLIKDRDRSLSYSICDRTDK